MHFYELIKNLSNNKELILFVDMDGVIASYEIAKAFDFDKKRPLKTRIQIFKDLNKLNNVELHILSVCHLDSQIKEKNDWLDKEAPFFEKDKRTIISKESHPGKETKNLKLEYLKTVKTNKQIIFIDDDNELLKHIHKYLPEIILYQDSELVD